MRHWMSVRADGSIINIQKYEYGHLHPDMPGYGGYPQCDPNDDNDVSQEAVQVRKVRDDLNSQGAGITRLIEFDCPCAQEDGICLCPDARILDSYYDVSGTLVEKTVTAASVDGDDIVFGQLGFYSVETIRAPSTVVEVVVSGLPSGEELSIMNISAQVMNPKTQTVLEGVGPDSGKWKFNITFPSQGMSGVVLIESARGLCRALKFTGFA